MADGDSPDSTDLFRLSREWQFWLIIVTTGRNRQYQVEDIVKVSDARNFIHYLILMERQAPFSDFHCVNNQRPSLALFREDVQPAWEHQANHNGHILSFELGRDQAVQDVWRALLFEAVSSKGIDGRVAEAVGAEHPGGPVTVNGAIITLKAAPASQSERFVFEVWIGPCDRIDALAALENVLREVVISCTPKIPQHRHAPGDLRITRKPIRRT
jgi:hypothetical protein